MKVFNMEFKSQREIILTCKYCSKQLQNRLNNVPIYLFTFFSCFLLTMHSDSIEGIYDTLKQCALISKSAGGIGINVHNIRCTGSYIAGVSTLCYRWFMLYYLFQLFPVDNAIRQYWRYLHNAESMCTDLKVCRWYWSQCAQH